MTHRQERLTIDGLVVAVEVDGTAMLPELSPRPYLHPVTTLDGALVSEAAPDDHPHHAGVGLPLADVDGTSYWGGRTFVRGRGSLMLENHGSQRVTARTQLHDGWCEDIDWIAPDGRRQIAEVRTVRASPCADGWKLDWWSDLTALADLSIGSPSTNGRPGAFYGGWLWRTPLSDAAFMVRGSEGLARCHGSRSPWLAVSTELATIVAVQQGEPLPWFVRSDPHAYFGPGVAVDERRELHAGHTLALALSVLVLDGARTHHEVADLADEILSAFHDR